MWMKQGPTSLFLEWATWACWLKLYLSIHSLHIFIINYLFRWIAVIATLSYCLKSKLNDDKMWPWTARPSYRLVYSFHSGPFAVLYTVLAGFEVIKHRDYISSMMSGNDPWPKSRKNISERPFKIEMPYSSPCLLRRKCLQGKSTQGKSFFKGDCGDWHGW